MSLRTSMLPIVGLAPLLFACSSPREAAPQGAASTDRSGGAGSAETGRPATGGETSEEARGLTPQPAAPAEGSDLGAVLTGFEERLPTRPYRVAIGNLRYRASEIGGEYAAWLAGLVSGALGASADLEEYARRDLDAVLAEHQLSVTDLVDGRDAPQAGLLKGVQGVIVGEYWEEGSSVRASLRLVDVESGRVLASGDVALEPAGGAPPARPADLERTGRALDQFRSGRDLADFDIELWVDRGSGGLYHLGEKLKVHFRAAEACWVRLYHLGANDELQLIYPNAWSGDGRCEAGRLYTIPPDDSFEFTMSKPLGTELLYAVASTRPFQSQERSFEALGGSGDIGAVRARGIQVTGGGGSGRARMAEATCVYTIVE